VAKVLYLPISVLGGLIAGVLGRRLFEALWSVIDADEPPDPKQPDVSWKRIVLALILEGAIFRLVRGLVDRSSRKGFSRLTGSWPGEERPQAA